MSSDKPLKLPKALDDHLTRLLVRCPGLTITMAVNDQGLFYVSFSWSEGRKTVYIHTLSPTLEDAYRITYATLGMNTGIW